MTNLFNAINRLPWQNEDEITVYYPKATNNQADIGKHLLKEKGNSFLQPNIFNV
jgi:hypothetical protein